MKTHTSQFKNNIKQFGRELDSKITYAINSVTTELGGEQLNSVSPHYEGAILKSVMKQLDIDSNVEIPVGTILTYQFGVKVGNSYEYISYGNYVVYNVEKQEDTNSYKITCYDKILYAMKDYENLNVTYPITVKNYLIALCTKIGLTFKDSNFGNYNRQIQKELYLDENNNSLGYTYRDVLDEIAQVAGGTICINGEDKLEVRYINQTNDTIDEEMLKDINVNFGEKYGPVNTIVLSRSAGADKVSLSQPTNLPDADKIAIEIADNQIMNGLDRADYLSDLLNKLYGLEYYINDYSSTGICYLDLCDKYNVEIDGNTYPCIMFNDNVNITQGLEEQVYTDMPEEAKEDYKYIGDDDRKVTQAYIIADKAQGEIVAVTNKIDEANGRINSVEDRQTATERTIEVKTQNIDANGNITEVTTTTGFTFNADGMTINKSGSSFYALHREDGTFYYDGGLQPSNIVGQYTKDGSKQKDLELFGVYYYGKDDIEDSPMFVAQLYTDENGEECFGHFYNRGD